MSPYYSKHGQRPIDDRDGIMASNVLEPPDPDLAD